MSVKQTLLRNISLILLLLLAISIYYNIDSWKENNHLKHQNRVVFKAAVQEVKQTIAPLIEAAKKQEQYIKSQEAIAAKKDTIVIPITKNAIFNTIDSVRVYALMVNKYKAESEKNRKSDSISKQQTKVALHQRDSVIKGNQNLAFMLTDMDGRLSALDSVNYAHSLNKIVGEQVKIKRSRFFFSKQDDYLRIKKIGDTASINGKNYILYPTENKYVNQLLLQVRGSYNYGSDRYSIGPGIELKLGGKGFNAAYLGDATQLGSFFSKAAFVFGVRLDVFHTTFQSKRFNSSKN